MQEINNWLDIFMQSTQGALEMIISFVPKFFASLIILIVGWITAKIIQKLSNKFLDLIGINKLSTKAGIENFLISSGFPGNLSWTFSRILYWTVLLIFILPISDIMGLPFFANLVNTALAYIPNIFLAMLVILVGSWAAKILSGMIRGSSVRLGIEYSEALGTIVNIGVMIVTFIIALSQLKIDATILSNILLIVVSAFAIGLSIAFGLGAKDLVRNVISGVYISKTIKTGSTVRIKDMVGKLVDVGPVISTIEVDDKQISVSNGSIMEIL